MAKRYRRTDNLAFEVAEYANSRVLELHKYNGGLHLRLMDAGYTVIDVWPSTGKYWVLETNYFKQTSQPIVERGGEKGFLPFGRDQIQKYIDGIIYAAYTIDD